MNLVNKYKINVFLENLLIIDKFYKKAYLRFLKFRKKKLLLFDFDSYFFIKKKKSRLKRFLKLGFAFSFIETIYLKRFNKFAKLEILWQSFLLGEKQNYKYFFNIFLLQIKSKKIKDFVFLFSPNTRRKSRIEAYSKRFKSYSALFQIFYRIRKKYRFYKKKFLLYAYFFNKYQKSILFKVRFFLYLNIHVNKDLYYYFLFRRFISEKIQSKSIYLFNENKNLLNETISSYDFFLKYKKITHFKLVKKLKSKFKRKAKRFLRKLKKKRSKLKKKKLIFRFLKR